MRNKAVLLYFDQYEPIRSFSDAQLGQLLRGMFVWMSGEEPTFSDPLVQMSFRFFRMEFERNEKRYEEIREKRSEAGKKGGRPSKANAFDEKQKNQKVFNESTEKQKKLIQEQEQELNQEQDQDISRYSSSLRSEEVTSVDAPSDAVDESPAATPKNPLSVCPYREILKAYQEILPTLPQVNAELFMQSSSRKSAMKARWQFLVTDQECLTQADGIETFRKFFEWVSGMPFLMGENDRHWKANLDWMMKQENFSKICEKRYVKRNKDY